MSKFDEAIISIRPKFVEAILSGLKTVELRRRIPSIQTGTRLWIYATRPIAAIVGSAVVEDIIRGSPDEVWTKGGSEAGIDRSEYDAYLNGANQAVVLMLSDIKKARPVSIEELRSIRSGFHPPQTMLQLSKIEAEVIHHLATTKDHRLRGNAFQSTLTS